MRDCILFVVNETAETSLTEWFYFMFNAISGLMDGYVK